ncbi:MAG: rRNA maturation RNase YbeY [Endomicrobium sp.]|jgi:probable rRNA maturation factor|nr:rRNA maturation RNase YbeY [Endomicrobium sp.]
MTIKKQEKIMKFNFNMLKYCYNIVNMRFINFQKHDVALLRRSASTVLEVEKIKRYQINFVMVSNERIKKLNTKYRKVKRVTDVISFLIDQKMFIGDIYISKRYSQKQAKIYRNTWKKELAYLVIHGVLHLCGYTDYDEISRAKMFAKQDKIFKRLFSHVR